MCDEMKWKVKEVYEKNLSPASNIWATFVTRYSTAFLNWTKEETKELNTWTRKQVIAGRALYPKSDVMRIHIKRRYGGRGLISMEKCCAAELRIIE